MRIERQPLVNLQRKEISYQARISALGSLNGALASLQTAASNLLPASGKTAAEKYTSFSANVADTTIASATASAGAVPGAYTLEVSRLAQSQRLVTATPGLPPASPYANADASIAQGTLTIDFGKLSEGVYTDDSARRIAVTIGPENATLGGLRDAINAANGGVTATIITGSAGAQLVLTAKNSGNENVMRLSGLAGFVFDPVTATGDMTENAAQGGRAAQNAAFTINGIAASSSTNSVSGVLDGVTLTLRKTNVGSPTDITVSKDTTTALTFNLNAFVKNFNEASSTIRSLGAYNAETKESGPLQGRAVIRNTQSQLRNLVFNTTAGGGGPYQRLADIGISFNKEGDLVVDSGKLNKAMAADYDAVLRLVTNVGQAFKQSLETVAGSGGTISGLTDSLNRMIKDLDSQRTILNQRLLGIEERYRKQFTALDTLISGMKETSTYLAQQLAALPGVGGTK
jgi:flagellar hook-associated protein 2